MGRVQDKVAIITGAASGLGFAAARKLLEEGAKVILTDVNREVLDSMPERLGDFSESQFQSIFHDRSQFY
jgi:3alpha(or 20beta)-hydroxysteroid dehydrogenase